MIKFENTEVVGWEPSIRGMRNPMNSWEKSDTGYVKKCSSCKYYDENDEVCRASDWSGQSINEENCYEFVIGPNDQKLMEMLRNAGTDHRKFMRMIIVYVDITAPLYWWKEFDTYKVGTVANSCSTMHTIHKKEFTLDDFSSEHLIYLSGNGGNSWGKEAYINDAIVDKKYANILANPKKRLLDTIHDLNVCREMYLKTKDKVWWWQMIQILPSSYNQKRTIMFSYETLANMYKSRYTHKLDEWRLHGDLGDGTAIPNDYGESLCDWIKTLPYSKLITGPKLSDIPISKEIMEEAKRRVLAEMKKEEKQNA